MIADVDDASFATVRALDELITSPSPHQVPQFTDPVPNNASEKYEE